MSSVSHRATPKGARASRSKELAKAACYTCRRKKVRCSGTTPCTYCSKRGFDDCEIPEQGQRRVYSILEIQQLRERLARYENPVSSAISDAVDIQSPIISNIPIAPNNNDLASHVSSPIPTQYEATQLSPVSAIQPESCLSSSHIFGFQIQSLLQDSHSRQNNGAPPRKTGHCPTGLGHNVPDVPTESESRQLLEVVIFYIGETQHHFDTREFSDNLGLFFTNSPDVAQQTPWFLEMLLVLAIGKLFSGDFDDHIEIPGSKLFNYVYANLPTLGELYTYGVLGVEILALVAVYLQNLNRKDEAYLHISTALRLAISLGLHRRSGSRLFLQSKMIHVNRLWWTIYMQERRLAAATGNPVSINDDAIELDMPTDCVGYSTALPLRTNFKISKVLSRIITVIYGPRRLTEDAFVPNVREIVKSILDIAEEIPSVATANYPGLSPDSSTRASAYLHLMLYQALILTTRPIMLHVAKQIVNGESIDSTTPNASPLDRLSRSCSEAARRLLDVIMTLRRKNMLIIFGFFDFDAVFSAAFVMILSAIIDTITVSDGSHGGKQVPPPGLRDALETLQYLADRGNHFAKRGYEEVRQTWSHLSAYLQQPQHVMDAQAAEANARSSGTLATPVVPRIVSGSGNGADTYSRASSAGDHTFASTGLGALLDTDLLGDFAHIWDGAVDQSGRTFPDGTGYDPGSTDGQHRLYPLYSNLDMDLTGGDMEDFTEFRRSVLNL